MNTIASPVGSRPRRPLAALCALAPLVVMGCVARTPLLSPSGSASEPGDGVDTGGATSAVVGGAASGGGNPAGTGGAVVTGGSVATTGGRASGGASGGSGGVTGSGGASASTGGTSRSGGGISVAGGITTSGGRSAAGGASSTAGGATAATGGSRTGGMPTGGNTTAAGGRSAVGGSVATGGTTAPGAPAISDSGYVKVSAGTTILAGFVSSAEGGSGSSIALTYGPTSFCASGTVGMNSTYNCWANAGFNVNQAPSGASGSSGPLVLSGSTFSLSYVNKGGSPLEFQLFDGSNYWCYQLPPSTSPTTKTIPFSSLNTQCWNNGGSSFASGTAITSVQLTVPGSNASPTPFDFCFLGLTIQ
jgi:hypothetical protein